MRINQEEKIVATIVVSNNCSIWILEADSDHVQFSWNGGTIRNSQVRYDNEGEAYFISGRTKWYLNQAMRINR
jgi:hypothetical protein